MEHKAKHKKNRKKATPNRLELLVTIVDRSKGEFYADLIQAFDVNMQMLCFGHGTAKAEMLRYLGLADSKELIDAACGCYERHRRGDIRVFEQ